MNSHHATHAILLCPYLPNTSLMLSFGVVWCQHETTLQCVVLSLRLGAKKRLRSKCAAAVALLTDTAEAAWPGTAARVATKKRLILPDVPWHVGEAARFPPPAPVHSPDTEDNGGLEGTGEEHVAVCATWLADLFIFSASDAVLPFVWAG